jgi:hypothetical protein
MTWKCMRKGSVRLLIFDVKSTVLNIERDCRSAEILKQK